MEKKDNYCIVMHQHGADVSTSEIIKDELTYEQAHDELFRLALEDNSKDNDSYKFDRGEGDNLIHEWTDSSYCTKDSDIIEIIDLWHEYNSDAEAISGKILSHRDSGYNLEDTADVLSTLPNLTWEDIQAHLRANYPNCQLEWEGQKDEEWARLYDSKRGEYAILYLSDADRWSVCYVDKYVDLELPSGTRWASEVEQDEDGDIL